MDNQHANQAALMVMKKEIVATTNTTGWAYIRKFADRVVTDMERKAIDEEDDVKGNNLRREAKAARIFFNDLMTRIELAKQVTDEPTDDDFVDIAMD